MLEGFEGQRVICWISSSRRVGPDLRAGRSKEANSPLLSAGSSEICPYPSTVWLCTKQWTFELRGFPEHSFAPRTPSLLLLLLAIVPR